MPNVTHRQDERLPWHLEKLDRLQFYRSTDRDELTQLKSSLDQIIERLGVANPQPEAGGARPVRLQTSTG